MAKKGQARRAEIIRLVSSTGVATVEELAATLQVTSSTIRRDLAKLTDQGELARTYGGVMRLDGRADAGPTPRARLGDHAAAKRGIAAWAAAEVQAGETIGLDGGSTLAALAEALQGGQDLMAVSASLALVDLLQHSDRSQVMTLGGQVLPPYQVTVGPYAEAMLARFTFDRVFIGARGLHPERGLNEPDFRLAALKEQLMGRARHVYVLAHAAKLTNAPFHTWPKMPTLWTLVTDDSADEDVLETYRDAGVDVVVTHPITDPADDEDTADARPAGPGALIVTAPEPGRR